MDTSTPLKSIRSKCLECSGGVRKEVENCTVGECPLFYFRFGKNPFSKRKEMSEEQRKAAGERLKKAREAKGKK